jgi:GxxExxY protein
MHENDVAKIVVDAAYKIHSQLGPSLLESAYQAILVYELRKRGLKVSTEFIMPVKYEGVVIDAGFRADVLVEDLVILELKSVETVADVHKKQLLTYLRSSGKRLGLLINFGAPVIRQGITRIVNGLD